MSMKVWVWSVTSERLKWGDSFLGPFHPEVQVVRHFAFTDADNFLILVVLAVKEP